MLDGVGGCREVGIWTSCRSREIRYSRRDSEGKHRKSFSKRIVIEELMAYRQTMVLKERRAKAARITTGTKHKECVITVM